MSFCSIDSSTKKTGMSLFKNDEQFECKQIDLSDSRDTTDARMSEMGRNILLVLNEWNPDGIYIEEPKGEGRNVELVHKLSEIIGVVRGWAITHDGCYFEEVKPSVWRKYVGITQGRKKREELKTDSINLVKDVYGIDVNDDVADSICIGIAMLRRSDIE